MVSSVHGGDGKTKVFLDTGVGKVLLYSYENLGGRKEGREGGRQAGSWGGEYGVRERGEMERWRDGSRKPGVIKG